MTESRRTPDPLTTLTFKVAPHEEKAFIEHADQFFVDETPAQRAAQIRYQEGEQALNSLALLCEQAADEQFIHASVLRSFLLSLHAGERHPFNLRGLQELDSESFEHCLAILRLNHEERVPVFSYFEDGLARFDQLTGLVANN